MDNPSALSKLWGLKSNIKYFFSLTYKSVRPKTKIICHKFKKLANNLNIEILQETKEFVYDTIVSINGKVLK